MHLRTRTWFIISLILLALSGFFGYLAQHHGAKPRSEGSGAAPAWPPDAGAFPLLSAALTNEARQAGSVAGSVTPNPSPTVRSGRLPYQLTNSRKAAGELRRSDTAVLLRQAVIDTAEAVPVPVPEALRAPEDPGHFIVQAKGVITPRFRAIVEQSGGRIVSYLPNNAYLVRLGVGLDSQLARRPEVQSVLPYEPYYKLDDQLLGVLLDQKALPEDGLVGMTVLPEEKGQVTASLAAMNAALVAEDRSPFGAVLMVKPDADQLLAIARMPEVQLLEVRRPRKLMNDLTRVKVQVAPDSVTETNYLELTGDNVLVNLNDSGVDARHPDLADRVTAADPTYLRDFEGHGTHVAGIIASSGEQSSTVTGASLSVSNANFRGMAPKAKLFILPINVLTGGSVSDGYLQETAAEAEAFISNNSWNYAGSYDYDSSAASYDAAVRDALPEKEGSTPMLYVWAAGNAGDGDSMGLGGEAGSVLSPSTAKNVITVGAIDSYRLITDEVVDIDDYGNTVTNQQFLGMTDSDNEVSPYSGRGNVGIGLEGDYGRFKPDVVAPGSFLVSTRSLDWTSPEAFTNARVNTFEGQVVEPGDLNNYNLYIPEGALEVRIELQPNRLGKNVPGLPLYLRYENFPSTNDLVNTNNLVVLPTDFPLQGGNLYYSVGNPNNREVIFDLKTTVILTNAPGNYFEVLAGINERLGPYYRYESGTSMATPVVSGILALMQEFFEQRFERDYSPALLKALLINGARSVNPIYSLDTRSTINHQGWGLVNLTNSLPSTWTNQTAETWPTQFFDQSPTNAVATGEQRSWKLQLASEAVARPLRITLVWTDPPGNPAAGVKLVNDLDLVLTNLDTGDVYFGNDIPSGNDFNQISNTNSTPDRVNNVENILIREPLGTNFAVTVFGHRVNVNAVAVHTNNIVQDFALVITSGSTTTTNTLTLTLEEQEITPSTVNTVTNGIPLLNQRVGANSPLIGEASGQSNQWHFYVFTNIYYTNSLTVLTNGTNVAFITFVPPNLAVPRISEADIDLYVSTNAALLNLDPAALAAADKSTNRGGTELVFYTNAAIGTVYYVGVKSEDQQAAEYGFVGLSTDMPFDEDVNGGRLVHVMWPQPDIPDGSPQRPGGRYGFGVATRSFDVRRVVVTNAVAHEDFGDLFGNLSHATEFVVLNSHSLLGDYSSTTNVLIYDDSDRGDILFSQLSDGPGSLNDFLGLNSGGVWLMTMVDNSLTHTGRVVQTEILIERGGNGMYGSVEPGRFGYWYVEVPEDAIALTVEITGLNDTLTVPLELYVRREDLPTRTEYDKMALIRPPGGLLTLSTNDVPPLTMGDYYIGVFNPNVITADFYINITVVRSLDSAVVDTYTSPDTPLTLLDDATTTSSLRVTADRALTDVKVGVRIDHPRVSDLVMHLVSPQGTRLLLAESRGGATASSYGSGEIDQTNLVFAGFTENTNITTTPIKYAEPPFTTNATITPVFTNDFEGVMPGVYGTNTVVDGWRVTTNYVEVITTNNAFSGTNVLGLNVGRIARSVTTVPGRRYWLWFAFKAGDTNVISAQVVLDGKLQPWLVATNDQWQSYQLSFTAGRSETLLEIAPAFRGDVLLDAFNMIEAGGVKYYLPEESLEVLKGEVSLGEWKLEILDNRAGPEEGVTELLTWQLQLVYVATNYHAITLTNGVPYSSKISGGETKFFIVNAPSVAQFATNLVVSGGDVVMLYNANGLPTGSASDVVVDNYGLGGEILILNTSTAPILRPGQRYYLGVRNSDPTATNDFTIVVDFDRYDAAGPTATALTNGVPLTATVDPGTVFDYYQFTVSTNAAWAVFELTHLTGNGNLYLKRGAPIPTSQTYHYASQNSGTNDEQIVVLTNSLPTPLAPGTWYLGVQNLETNAITYTITATEFLTVFPSFIVLTNGVPYTSTVSNAADYYELYVEPGAVWASFEVLNPDGNVNLVARRGPLFPTPTGFDYQSINPGTNEELILVFTNSVPVPLTPGYWYLSVYNLETNPVTYVLQATVYGGEMPRLVTLTNGVAYTSTLPVTNLLDLYRFDVSLMATQALFEVYGANGNVDLFARKGLPFVNETNAFYASTNSGTSNELILLLTNTVPIPLSPGIWFLGAINRDTNDVTYTIRATEFLSIIPGPDTNIVIIPRLDRTNGMLCLSWNSLIGTNYYVEGRVNVEDPGWNIISPTITATSLVTSYCVSLTDSNRFFQVIQGTVSGGGTNIPPAEILVPPQILPDGRLQITWDSVAGAIYEVSATTNWASWVTLTNITATGTRTTYIDPVTVTNQPLRFYRVRVLGGTVIPGGGTNAIPAEIIVPPVVQPGQGLLVTWESVVGASYEVQVTTNWTAWITLTNLVATGTQTSYLDTTSAALQPIRFYRVRTTSGGSGGSSTNLPPVSLEVPWVIQTNGLIQLTWESVVGEVYTVQYSTNLITWNSLTNIVATATQSVFTDPTAASESRIRFYRLLLPP